MPLIREPATNIKVNGVAVTVPAGATVAIAILLTGNPNFTPLCGMGICYQCRVTLNGLPHARACQIGVAEGMEVRL